MNHINLIYGNHGNYTIIQDHVEYVTKGLQHVSARVYLNESSWFPNGVNLMLECNDRDSYSQLIDLKKRSPEGKFFLIVTEVIADNRFNSANSSSSQAAATNFYDNADYWKKRFADFMMLLPYLDGIICVSETLLDGYRQVGKPLYYLPMAAPAHFPRLEQVSADQRYIDFLFTGSLTPHREEIHDKLVAYGNHVVALPTTTPDFFRSFFHRHAKLVIGPRLDKSTKIVSKARAHFVLSNRLPHLFERTPDQTDIHPHLDFCCDNSTFVAECIEKARSNIPFSEKKFMDFVSDPALNYERIFQGLSDFLADPKMHAC